MRGRRLRWWLVGLALLLGILFTLLSPQSDRVDLGKHVHIRMGMSLTEVQALLGGPPGDYRTMPPSSDFGGSLLRAQKADSTEFWQSDDLFLSVVFDDQGRASWIGYSPMPPTQANTLENLVWRAKRQWRRWFP